MLVINWTTVNLSQPFRTCVDTIIYLTISTLISILKWTLPLFHVWFISTREWFKLVQSRLIFSHPHFWYECLTLFIVLCTRVNSLRHQQGNMYVAATVTWVRIYSKITKSAKCIEELSQPWQNLQTAYAPRVVKDVATLYITVKQRLRSALASAQSDQSLCCALNR